MKLFLTLTFCTLFIGCATASGPAYIDYKKTEQELDDAKSRIVLYRIKKEAQGNGLSTYIFIDGQRLGRCDYTGFCSFDIAPGKHVLKVDDSGGAFGFCESSIEIEPKQKKFFKISPRKEHFGSGSMFGAIMESKGKSCGGVFSFSEIDENTAENDLLLLRATKQANR